MKTEKYLVEIEMPDGDGISPLWIKDILQSDADADADAEDKGRWKVSVKKHQEPTEEPFIVRYHNIQVQIDFAKAVIRTLQNDNIDFLLAATKDYLEVLEEQIGKLK